MFMLVVSMDQEFGEKAQIPQPPRMIPKTEPRIERTVVIEVIWTPKSVTNCQDQSGGM